VLDLRRVPVSLCEGVGGVKQIVMENQRSGEPLWHTVRITVNEHPNAHVRWIEWTRDGDIAGGRIGFGWPVEQEDKFIGRVVGDWPISGRLEAGGNVAVYPQHNTAAMVSEAK
jgi:hypothetical protein